MHRSRLMALSCVAIVFLLSVPVVFSQQFFVTNYPGTKMFRFDANGALLSPPALGCSWWDITIGPDGNIYWLDDCRVQRFDGETGEFLGNFIQSGSFWGGLAFGPDGDLYVGCGNPTSQINRYDGVTGAFKNIFLSRPNERAARDFEFGPDGNLYVVWLSTWTPDYPQNLPERITKHNGQTGEIIQDCISWGALFDLKFGPDGFLYVADNSGGSVRRINPETGEEHECVRFDNPYGSPSGLAWGPDGALYVSDMSQQVIYRVPNSPDLPSVFVDFKTQTLVAYRESWQLAPSPMHLVFSAPVNKPPVAIGKDIRRPAGIGCQAYASALDFNNGSYDPDGDALNYVVSPAGPYNLGDTLVTLTVTDSHGASASCTATITVNDNAPPTITSLVANPNSLWPANKKMVPISITVLAFDNCSPAVTSKIVNVTSNEPTDVNAPDWIITGPLNLNLRADCLGNGNGRIYTITVECGDAARNKTTGIVTVRVPHDQGK